VAERPNRSAHPDKQLQVSASRRVLRAGGLQRWAESIGGALMLKTLLAITMVLFAPICLADQVCENLAKKVLEYKGHTSKSWIGSICKSKPADIRKSFLVMDNQIYLIDINSGQVLSQGELGNISFNIESIDTGRYWLKPKLLRQKNLWLNSGSGSLPST
jgi:hypothetical protein